MSLYTPNIRVCLFQGIVNFPEFHIQDSASKINDHGMKYLLQKGDNEVSQREG